MDKIKEIVNYIYPVTIETRAGNVTPYLEVMKYKGKYILNSRHANYSFGGLHTIFDQLFKKINIRRFEFKNVLILGMGAGSIISLLKQKYEIDCPVTAVEKDEVVIALAKKYFGIEDHRSLEIINEDAFKYVSSTQQKYDLIIIDLFVESDVPKIFASNEFLLELKRISDNNCCIIYNKMTEQYIHKKEFAALSENFELIFPDSEIHKFNIYDSENSLLYYNTLPISIGAQDLSKKYYQSDEGELPVLKPFFQIHGSKINQ